MGKEYFDTNLSIIPIRVRLKINGKSKYARMAVDTGASLMLIGSDVAEALGVSIPEGFVQMLTTAGAQIAPMYSIDEVEVCSKRVRNVQVIVHNLPEDSYVDGLLGLNVLRNFNMNINFDEGILELS